ncbi:MAG: epoxyqueuosine reductase, partial [Defluviitaleaceae bacterium]|nr:epoxyqueuosine reductase [Defluviitaleaceae bacterium]
MNNLTKQIKDMMLANGADLVGVGDLADVNAAGRHGLPMGISLAVKYPSDVIRGIAELPNREYVNWYDKLNERLDSLVTLGAQTLRGHGYTAVAMTREQVKADKPGYMDDMITLLPHKTVATRAGLGWIGRCAMLVTPEYGSMVRISTILTDAPL